MAELMSFWTYSPFFQTIGFKQSGRITSHKVFIALDLITQLLETRLKETLKGTKSPCGDVPISTFLIKRWNQSEMVIGRKWISTLGLLNSIKHYIPGTRYTGTHLKSSAFRTLEPKSSKQTWVTRTTGGGGRRQRQEQWLTSSLVISSVRGGGRKIRCQGLCLYSEFQANMGYMRPWLKTTAFCVFQFSLRTGLLTGYPVPSGQS